MEGYRGRDCDHSKAPISRRNALTEFLVVIKLTWQQEAVDMSSRTVKAATYYLMLFVLTAYMYLQHIRALCQEGQKRTPDSLELELRMAVNHCVSARNGIQVFCKSNKCSHLLSPLQFPIDILTPQ